MFYDVMYYHIKFTNKCDKACSYCFDDKSIRGRVTFEDFKALVDKSSGYEKVHYTFMGGEPLLMGPMLIEQCCQYAQKVAAERCQQLEFKIITNGSHLNDSWISLFKRYGIYVVVSYDGRGQEKAEIDLITKYAADIDTINFTMNADNYHLFYETIEELDSIGITYFDGYVNVFSKEEDMPKYIEAFKHAFAQMKAKKHNIKWFLYQDLVRYAKTGKQHKRNTQIAGVYQNNDYSLRPGGVIMPSVQDSKFFDMTLGNIHDVDHIIDIIFDKPNIEHNKAYLRYLANLTDEQQFEKDVRGGYLFDKSTIGMELDANWDFMFDLYRPLLEYLKDQ